MNPQAQKYTDPLTQPGYTKEYGYNTPPLGKINSDSLSQAPDINFQTQPTPQPYNIASLGNFTPMQATPQETQASELTKRIQGFNQQLAGQSEFRAQQEQQLGVPELTKTQRELESRLTALKNESLAIPLQLQQQAQGRGITAGGLKPIETGKLRENAIQALSVNSLLEASRGNLTLAQDMVDKAVAQKYDPIKEQIAINTANLDLIIKDPTTSLQDKNRAEQQKLINEQRASAIAKKEEDEKSKRDFTIKLLANNPNLDPLYVKALEATKSYEEAVRVANTLGLVEDPLARQKAQLDIAKTKAEIGKINKDIVSSTGGQVKLSTPQQESIVSINTLSDIASQILNLGLQTNYAGIGGLGSGSIKQFLAKNLGTGSKEAQDLRNLVGNIQATIAKERGGTSFTANEQKLLETYTPTINDSALVIDSKVKSLQNFLENKKKEIVAVASGNINLNNQVLKSGQTKSGLKYTVEK